MAKVLVKAVFPKGGFGFDGLGRRHDGDRFTIDESKFDETWMELMDVDLEAEPDTDLDTYLDAAPEASTADDDTDPDDDD